jgi:uncharacterized protein YdeI (YjbR/CyaY-like superfamily)
MERWKGFVLLKAKDRKTWRTWLAKNHDRETGVWLVIPHKGFAPKAPDAAVAVEEALCFGWIDSVKHKYDAHSAVQFFGPRKPKGKWSAINRERVSRLVKEGLMMPAGQAMIDLAKRTGTWESRVESHNAVVPDDLQRAFNKNKTALKHFEAFPPSSKRIILEWVLNAKRPETRTKRIAETVALAAKNVRANHPRR